MIVRNRVVQPDAEVCAKNGIQSFFSIHARCRFVTGVRANLFSLNPFQQLVIEHMHWKEKILANFVDVVVTCVLKSGALVFYCELVHQRPRNVLDEKFVCVGAGQIDVETQRQR